MREPVAISSHSSRRFGGAGVDPRAVGRELGARYLVSGTARGGIGRLRISVGLTDVESGIVMWAHPYETGGRELFDAQDDIARRVVATIVPQIHESEMRRIRGKSPEVMTAYDLVLRARDTMFKLDPRSFGSAGDLLARAAAMDPGYATAHALAAHWHALRVGQGWSPDPDADSIASDRAAQAALANDSLNAQALALHAHTRSFLHRDYDHAARLFDRALDIAPNEASAWMWSAGTAAYVGDGAEAVRRAEKALALSPLDRFSFRYDNALCLAHYTNGSFDEAVRWGMRAIDAAPGYTAAIRFAIAACAASGRSGQARELARKLLDAQPDFRVRGVRARHPYRDAERREEIADRLLSAGLPE
jgi:tetratricopeptide (TPR) repeat protein